MCSVQLKKDAPQYPQSKRWQEELAAALYRAGEYAEAEKIFARQVDWERPFGNGKIRLRILTAPKSSETGLRNTFIELKQKDGTIEALYDHWILGRDAGGTEPRWSIIRNVLNWID